MEAQNFLNGRVIVKTGDITAQEVDAIVNAANSSLLGGGGVDGAIHRAGGPAILEECRKIREEQFPQGLPTGEAVITRGGNLKAPHVIHTVGPIWKGGSADEETKLANCYRNSLQIAAAQKLSTIAFPAISTGVYGYPPSLAAKVSSKTVAQFLQKEQTPNRVTFIFFSPADMNLFLDNCLF